MNPRLRFKSHQIESIAARYQYVGDDSALMVLKPTVLKYGHLTKAELK